MAAFRRLVIALGALGMLAGLASAQTSQAMNCTLTTFPNTIRLEGKTEQVGDITITCTGGTALTDGATIPLVNFTIQLGGVTNAISSRQTDVTHPGVSDALLLIDEPGSGGGPVAGFGSDAAPKLCGLPTTGCAAPFKETNTGNPVMSDTAVAGGNPGGAFNAYQGVVSGTSVTFIGIPVMAPATAGSSRVFRITNVRVDSTTQAAGATVTANITFTGTNVSSLLSLPQNSASVSVIQNGLSAANTKATPSSSPVCMTTGTKTYGAAIGSIQFGENFGSAFKTRLAGVAGTPNSIFNVTVLPPTPAGGAVVAQQSLPGVYASESGLTLPLGTGYTGLADYGTRLKATFANIPTGVRLFVSTTNMSDATTGATPVTPPTNVGDGSVGPYAQLLASTTTEASVDSSTGPGFATPIALSGGQAELTVTNGAATAIWEIENTNPTASETFYFTVYVEYSANVPPVTGTTAAPTPTVNLTYAPTAAPAGTTPEPLFVDAAQSPKSAFSLANCRTILLFPYITSNGGFDTGIAISNTSMDPLSTSAQAGACNLNWYPSGSQSATSTSVGTAITATTTPTVVGGTTYLNTASSLVPGFTGYMIAVCNFQYAHGFAFVADWGSSSTSSAMGYLALVIPDPGTAPGATRAVPTGGEQLNN